MRRRAALAWLVGLGAAGFGGVWGWGHRFDRIVIHHSAGATGSLELLRRVHRQRQPGDPIDMIPYHFVVGNGRGMGMGEIAPTGRWPRIWGAHTRNRRANLTGIGICLIGNFQNGPPSEAQYRAALDLAVDLARRYRIAADALYFHGELPGAQTLCPGRLFPRDRMRADFAAALAA
jgi:N-acetylmuramoyl-L-alanine amidase